VAVNDGRSPHIPLLRDKPLREGHGDHHNLYTAHLPSGESFTVFLDSGTTNCYAAKSLADKMATYKTQRPANMRGIGGIGGPQITHDAIVTAKFKGAEGPTKSFHLSAGVVPDGTFPGDLTIGNSVFHKWRISFDGSIDLAQRQVAKLRNFPGRPTLIPCDRVPKTYFANAVDEKKKAKPDANLADALAMRWGKDTPVKNPKIRTYLESYVKEFPGLFDLSKQRTDILCKTEHTIDTGDAQPIKLSPRRYSPFQLKAIRDFVYNCPIIRRGVGPWAAPLLLTPKKFPGTHTKPTIDEHTIWRICTDYRQLNKDTKKNGHPLPNAMDQIQRAAGHNFYCFIDLKDGFWRIKIAEKDREKTAFTTPFGLFEWTHMPFGLCNAPATFQALIDEITGDIEYVAGLLDDIAVWGDTLEQLHQRVRTVLRKLTDYGMILNVRKSTMFVTEGVFLGFVVSRDGIAADPDKVAAIRDRKEPATTTEVRAFTNAAGYFRHLIEKYALLSSPLTDLTGGPKNQPLKLPPAAKAAWQKIREIIITMPVVKSFD
jgi:hypothetical protein